MSLGRDELRDELLAHEVRHTAYILMDQISRAFEGYKLPPHIEECRELALNAMYDIYQKIQAGDVTLADDRAVNDGPD